MANVTPTMSSSSTSSPQSPMGGEATWKDSGSDALVEHMSTALQAQEKLLHAVAVKNQLAQCPKSLEECSEILESLRNLKGREEGTSCTLQRPMLYENLLGPLRQLVLMHVPQSLTLADKQQITLLVKQAFRGECEDVMFVGLSTCPWYQSTQPERGQQAKHNCLLIIFRDHLRHVFSPANAHLRQEREVLDLEWFYAIEVGHFVQCLAKGRTRCVECLFMPESAQIYASEQWTQLHQEASKQAVAGLPAFLDAACGQAVGMVARKVKGAMKMRDGASRYQFCQAFRLLCHMERILTGEELILSPLVIDQLTTWAAKAYQKINANSWGSQDGFIEKQELFELLMAWRMEMEKSRKSFINSAEVDEVHGMLGTWLTHVRLEDKDIQPQWVTPATEHSKVSLLLADIDPSLSSMDPASIVLIARAGSYLYGLSTATSDADYIIIYSEPTVNMMSSCKKVTENRECRGPEKTVEYGCYEVRLFCEMLLKGSVVVSELLFVDDIAFSSPAWQALRELRSMFITEHLLQQYLGLIHNNMRLICNGRFKDKPRERKLFYQIFHKLSGVENMLLDKEPCVRCEGPVRDFIMSIRNNTLPEEIGRQQLLEKAQNQVHDVREQLTMRSSRLPEYAHYGRLVEWLLQLRGVS